MGDGDKEFKEEEVATHNTEKDCYLIIGNEDTGGPMVYDVSKYMDDHPGGPEILMEYAGKDADEMFDAIGHSKEAKSKMKEMLVGKLYVDPDAPKKVTTKKKTIESKGGLNPFAVIVLLLAVAAGVYYSQMAK